MRTFDLPADDTTGTASTKRAQRPTVFEAGEDEVVVLPRTSMLNLGSWRPTDSNDYEPVQYRAHVRVGRAVIVPKESVHSLEKSGEAIAVDQKHGERPQLFSKVSQ